MSAPGVDSSALAAEVAKVNIEGGEAAAAAGKPKKEKKEKPVKEKVNSQAPPARVPGPTVTDGGMGEAVFGELSLICSSYKDKRNWSDINTLSAARANEQVWVRARVHASRGKGRFTFLVLRRGLFSVQAIVAEGDNMPKDAVKFAAKIPNESVVDIFGTIAAAAQPVTSTSQTDVELQVLKVFVVSAAASVLPFQLEDAARPEPAAESSGLAVAAPAADDKKAVEIRVGQDIRLDNRWLDLRTPANHAIFRLQSRVCEYYRAYFTKNDFVEIHTPKLTPGVSEGGANVFRLSYLHDAPACLAQSPQLYKQAAISADLFRVFEIGHVFRAEDSNTHRHMCEFIGLDFEMEIKQHYHEVLDVLSDLFHFIFDSIEQHCQKELAVIGQQYPFRPLQYRHAKSGGRTLVLPFQEAVRMLRAAGENIPDDGDFTTPQEKKLGALIKEQEGVDFYIVDKYPIGARPFYTMLCPENPKYTNSYDVFVRGEEITSGAQRIHEVELLSKRATECGIPLNNIDWYLESFKHGAWPHGGAGIGLERVVMLYLGLDNIRKSSMFPRTPYRLKP